MMTKSKLYTFLSSAVALAVCASTHSTQAMNTSGDKEKCYGVVKAGANDCASADGAHNCAGLAQEDASGQEWVGLPNGLCLKLAGASLTPLKPDAESAGDEIDASSSADLKPHPSKESE